MPRYSIGDIARKSGFNASTIRYYERIELLPIAKRVSKKRVYDEDILIQLKAIRLAKMLGFNIRDIKTLFNGFPSNTVASQRWQMLIPDKLTEIEQQIHDLQVTQRLLQSVSQCLCSHFEDCVNFVSD